MTRKNIQDIKPGEHFYSVTQGMRGWFACEFWMNNVEPDIGVFMEPWQSDEYSFATREEAVEWAITLAAMEGLPHIL